MRRITLVAPLKIIPETSTEWRKNMSTKLAKINIVEINVENNAL